MPVDDLSFEKEINSLLLASDQSDSNGDFEECIISESDLSQHHESDEKDDSEEDQVSSESVCSDNSENEINVPLSELRRSNFYYSKNRYKWSKTPPNTRIRTQQHNILTRACVSK
ncbi:hypothetical protein HHI36_008465 [Cryptolaemus montrouzieri]|uniref:Uncharacterized protein n=1 Tax=Cryptolaemus montrouzieri TaxID=559131 RepID=A0ABD2MSL4_9CUCU